MSDYDKKAWKITEKCVGVYANELHTACMALSSAMYRYDETVPLSHAGNRETNGAIHNIDRVLQEIRDVAEQVVLAHLGPRAESDRDAVEKVYGGSDAQG